MNEDCQTLVDASKEWLAARTAAIKDVSPQTFDRLARAEGALAKATRDSIDHSGRSQP